MLLLIMKKNIKIHMKDETINKVEKHFNLLKEKGIVKTKSDCLKLMIDIAHLLEKDKKIVFKNEVKLK